MKTFFNEVIKELNSRNILFCEQVRARFSDFCPEIQYITLDALKTSDYPSNIAENSIFVCFKIDMQAKKIEVRETGHVYLSDSDLKTDKYKYYCMKSMENILKDNGGKTFKKQGYKDVKNLCDKMEKYFIILMEETKKYTGGYPYKRGI